MRFDIFFAEREAATTLENGLRVWSKPSANGKVHGMVFNPKATKPTANYLFRDQERFDKYVAEYVRNYDAAQARKIEDRKKRTAGDLSLVDPGAVLRYSWGWEQTNVEYYQVVKRSGQTVTIAQIAQELVEQTGWLSERVRPAIGKFLAVCEVCEGRENWPRHFENCGAFEHTFVPKIVTITKRVQFLSGQPYLSMDHGSCYLVPVHRFGNAEPLVVESAYQSHYA